MTPPTSDNRVPWIRWEGEDLGDLDDYHPVDEELELGGRVLWHLQHENGSYRTMPWYLPDDAPSPYDSWLVYWYSHPEHRLFLDVLANILAGRTWHSSASLPELLSGGRR